jgi:drug/metabolite transporter (DMT)-like permease
VSAGTRSDAPAAPVSTRRQELVLVAITVLWGTTFLIVQTALAHCGPLFFVGFRFAVATLMSVVVAGRALAGITRHELVAGVAIGLTIVLAYDLQTLGLLSITSSQSAFITALYVPIVPLLQWAFGRRPGWTSVAGIGLAFAGLVLLTAPDAGALSLSRGELATIAGAVASAAQIVLIGRYAGTVDVRRVTVVQLAVTAALSLLLMPLAGEASPAFSWVWLAAAGGLGVASTFIMLAMNWAQQSISATRATVIYASEPVWAGVVGWMAGDRLPGSAFAGAALILAGVLVSEWKTRE